MSSDLEALLHEHRKFEPSEAFRAAALLSNPDVYEKASADPEAYWAEQAATLEWIAPMRAQASMAITTSGTSGR